MKKSWLHKLNYYILQWFCIRLAKVVNEKGKVMYYYIMWGIVPLTGWDGPYKYLYTKK